MKEAVLYVLVFFVLAFIAGRLSASGKKDNKDAGAGLMTLIAIVYVTMYLPAYGSDWLWVSLVLIVAFALGFLGKGGVTLLAHNKLRPWWQKTFGTWTMRSKDQDEHRPQTTHDKE